MTNICCSTPPRAGAGAAGAVAAGAEAGAAAGVALPVPNRWMTRPEGAGAGGCRAQAGAAVRQARAARTRRVFMPCLCAPAARRARAGRSHAQVTCVGIICYHSLFVYMGRAIMRNSVQPEREMAAPGLSLRVCNVMSWRSMATCPRRSWMTISAISCVPSPVAWRCCWLT